MAEPRQMPRRGPGAAAMPRPKLDHPGRIFKPVVKLVREKQLLYLCL